MATNYPGSLDTSTQQPSPTATTEMNDTGFEHDVVHTNHSGAIIALETKVGTGSSTAVADSVLAGTGAGTSAWTTGALANDTTGNAATATALATGRTISLTGDATGTSGSFDGTGNVSIATTLPNAADMSESTNAGRKITVSATAPTTGQTTGDLWVNIS
jgi:hypothetical protein